LEKQVVKSLRQFRVYMSKQRWLSLWHQLDEVFALNPSSILEVGPWRGVFKTLATHFGVAVETLDINPGFNPDHVASVRELPFEDNCFDCVCAFQMLEHLPYEQSLEAFSEMVRVAKDHVVISLPDAKPMWTYSLHIPIVGRQKIIHLPAPLRRRHKKHKFEGHHWEINKKGFPLKKIIEDFTRQNVKMMKTYRVNEFSYHRFFVFEKIG